MNKTCALQPFRGSTPPPGLELTATVSRQVNVLAIQYSLVGNLSELAIPAPALVPYRKHNLWEDTCFEFFLAVKHSPRYWEFNLSPSGHWNVYRFAAYRQDMQEEMTFTSLPLAVHRQSDSLSLNLEADLGQIAQADQAIELAISTVLQGRDGQPTYWALAHCGPQADFHLRDSFVVDL
jgi:hypothetical protein